MKKRLLVLGMVLYWSGIAQGSQSTISVSGTMLSKNERVAMINGNTYRVNDEISGGRITAIDEDGVTVLKDGKSTKYLVANAEPPKSESSEKPKSATKENWFSKMTKKLHKPESKNPKENKQETKKPTIPKDVSKLSLQEKMRWAERAFEHYKQCSEELINGPLQQCTSTRDFMKVMKQYSSMVDENTKQFNGLKLPCPQTQRGNDSYCQWSKAFEQRSISLSKEQNSKIQATAKKLGIEFN